MWKLCSTRFRVNPEDRGALRFLRWPDGNLDLEPEEFMMTVHLFGAVSSPSCANFALRKTAADNQADFSKEAVRTVDRNFYVDDCLITFKASDHPKNGTICCCTFHKAGQNDTPGDRTIHQRLSLLDGQHLCAALHR